MHPSTLKEVLLLLPYVLLVPGILAAGDALRLRLESRPNMTTNGPNHP
jgi:hypothetical protein